ncbi:MAG: serine hydrolase [Acidimicrobiales bacterium]
MVRRRIGILALGASCVAGVVATLSWGVEIAGTSPTTTTSVIATTTTVTSTTSSTTTSTTTTIPTPVGQNPFTVPAVALYLKNRKNLVTAAVYDVDSGRTYVYNPGVHERTASMVKIDILASLLWDDQEDGHSMTARELLLASKMIEQSNNGAADRLWSDIGGRDALDSFNSLIGFRQTIPSYSWGDIETTPRDQLQLLKAIVLPNRILNAASRKYEMGLMEDVDPGERFGLGWGSPPRVTVGLKDGYYPEATTGWQINTSGFVMYAGRLYLATIMCANNPDETYGIGTVTTLSRLIWENLKP